MRRAPRMRASWPCPRLGPWRQCIQDRARAANADAGASGSREHEGVIMSDSAKLDFVRLGDPAARVDGPAKVTGAARYGSDPDLASPVFAFLAVSPIARGHV